MNFLDNMDGLCAGVGLICAALFGLIAGIQHEFFVCLLAVALTGALIGFLPHNFKPASIFLGDAGSHFVGYMLAVLPICVTFYRHGRTPTLLPVLIPLLVLAVPLFDLVMVMWIRLRRSSAGLSRRREPSFASARAPRPATELGGHADLFDHADARTGRDNLAVVGNDRRARRDRASHLHPRHRHPAGTPRREVRRLTQPS